MKDEFLSAEYFGISNHCESELTVLTYGLTGARKLELLKDLLIQCMKLNFEKAIAEDERGFFHRFVKLIDWYQEPVRNAIEFPLHKTSIVIIQYYLVVHKNIELFYGFNERFSCYKSTKGISREHRDKKRQPEYIQHCVQDLNGSLLHILELIKASLKEPDFKLALIKEQKYFSKMKKTYKELADELIEKSENLTMLEIDFHTNEFIYDYAYIDDCVKPANDEVLEKLKIERSLLLALFKKKFSICFVSFMWKINHNSTSGFYLSLLIFLESPKYANLEADMLHWLKGVVGGNCKFNAIKSYSTILIQQPTELTLRDAIMKYVLMDSVLNLKLKGHQLMNRGDVRTCLKS